MSLHQCPRCDHMVATNSTTAGAFRIPPTIYCVHDDGAVEMDIESEQDLKEEAMLNE